MEVIHGNIFTTKCQTIVNTVNCFGVMGAGIALECKYRYPKMNERYIELCNDKLLKIGQLYLYKSDNKWILNFPTKYHWKLPTKEEYLEKGLKKFIETYQEKKITSIAFPLLGASHGGLDKENSLRIMEKYLKHVNIPIEIYSYNPEISDNLFLFFRTTILNTDAKKLCNILGLTQKQILLLTDALRHDQIKNMNNLELIRGIGDKAVQKCYTFSMREEYNYIQSKLF